MFRLDYMGREGCLAQSPQFYKQMAVVSDMPRVFEIGPVFRCAPVLAHDRAGLFHQVLPVVVDMWSCVYRVAARGGIPLLATWLGLAAQQQPVVDAMILVGQSPAVPMEMSSRIVHVCAGRRSRSRTGTCASSRG